MVYATVGPERICAFVRAGVVHGQTVPARQPAVGIAHKPDIVVAGKAGLGGSDVLQLVPAHTGHVVSRKIRHAEVCGDIVRFVRWVRVRIRCHVEAVRARVVGKIGVADVVAAARAGSQPRHGKVGVREADGRIKVGKVPFIDKFMCAVADEKIQTFLKIYNYA